MKELINRPDFYASDYSYANSKQCEDGEVSGNTMEFNKYIMKIQALQNRYDSKSSAPHLRHSAFYLAGVYQERKKVIQLLWLSTSDVLKCCSNASGFYGKI